MCINDCNKKGICVQGLYLVSSIGFVIVRKDFMDLIAHFQPKIGNYLAKIIAMEEVIVSVESVIVILDILDKHAKIKPILCVQVSFIFYVNFTNIIICYFL